MPITADLGKSGSAVPPRCRPKPIKVASLGICCTTLHTRTLVDLGVMKEFQDTVIETIRQESPDTARRIVTRLKERRALRPSAELPTLDSGGSDGLVA